MANLLFPQGRLNVCTAPHPSPRRGVPACPVSPESPVERVHGTSQTCRGWKFRGLEAWLSRWGSAPHPYNSSVARLPGALFSVLCSPFSGAALAAPPLPGRGAAPHSQSANLLISNQPIFFVSLAVEGLSLRACTVIAAQRSVSSPPRAAARASTSVAPPSLQASKLLSFHCASCRR